jgi:GT2 family glycosyltransferase
MSATPTLSFIVLSYNYADLIGQTVRSILDQTVQDFEVVVVDDASSDRSVEVVQSFGDPRIKLLVNEQNLGGAGSYNRAVRAATGQYLVNLDADDWIAPDKCERQLAYMRGDNAAVLGTHVNFVDRLGQPHPRAADLDRFANVSLDLNVIDTWIGFNPLVRSSTMIARTAHLEVGLDDPMMSRAPDYELWTRFLRAGHRIAVMPERLTFCRQHDGGVTHGDPRGSLLEIIYAMLCNLVPMIEERALWPTFARMVAWCQEAEAFVLLKPVERYRLLGMLFLPNEWPDFRSFRDAVLAETGGHPVAVAGRRVLAVTQSAMLAVTQSAVLAAEQSAMLAAATALANERLKHSPSLTVRKIVALSARAVLGQERATRVRSSVSRLLSRH